MPEISGSRSNPFDFPEGISIEVEEYSADRIALREVESDNLLVADGLADVPEGVALAAPSGEMSVAAWEAVDTFETTPSRSFLTTLIGVGDDDGLLFAFVAVSDGVGFTGFDGLSLVDNGGGACRFDERVDATVADVKVEARDGDVVVGVGDSAVIDTRLVQPTEAFLCDPTPDGPCGAGRVLMRRVE